MVDVTWVSKRISIMNFKDWRLLLNEQNELVVKCRYKGKWLGATEAPTLGNSRDIDEGILIGINNILFSSWYYYDGEIYVEEEILGNLDINSKFGVLISGVVNSPWPFLWLIKGTWWLLKGFLFFIFILFLFYTIFKEKV